MIFALASGYDLAIVIIVVLFGSAILLLGRRLSITVRGIAVTAERTDVNTEHVKKTVGEVNGSGDAMTVLSELDRKVSVLDQRLDDRTHVLRQGRTEREELGPYTQDRLHDVLGAVAVLALKIDTLWRFLKDDYQLPDLPSATVPALDDSAPGG